ncbi:unnamed protein product [Owenia fusiformis]|uniref:Beta-lactamase-related domain-containing protein n=1 Tax=Owenia fusiformis TaxID=6347 RepID=A0A8S4N4I0_OWEFU|nr:unnamed protein product [Owenia fusiformis]
MGIFTGALLICVTAVGVIVLQRSMQPKLTPIGDGYVGPGWRNVSDIFRKNVENGLERGGAFAVYYKGRLVVDLRGGYADVEAKLPWSKDTISQLFSTTKAIGAITIAHLVDKGLLDYNKPIATYWKDFAQNGKEKITLKMFLSHQAGLGFMDERFHMKMILTNWLKAGEILARQKPEWEPGTRHGYHMISFGLYLDQIVRRVDDEQRSLGQYFHEEIAKPFGLDIFIGLPFEENYRCARIYTRPLTDLLQTSWNSWRDTYAFWTSSGSKTLLSKVENSFAELPKGEILVYNRPHYRLIPNCAAYGFGTPVSVAKLMSFMSHGIDIERSKSLLTRKTVKKLLQKQVSGHDEVLSRFRENGTSMFSLGLQIKDHPVYPGKLVYGHDGYGGQTGFFDMEKDLAWGYVTNHMSFSMSNDDPYYMELVKAMYSAVEFLENKKE